jgi:hypothetical protein
MKTPTLLLLLFSFTARAWEPPIGIPEPNWPTIGNPIEATAPVPPDSTPPAGWTGEVPNRYYVDPGHGSATDTDNPYGFPAKPRKTAPSPLPAGAVVYTDVWDFNIPGYYYVKTGGSNDSQGYPSNSRFRLPKPIPAGAKVFMDGTCIWGQHSPSDIIAQGTPIEPVWICNYDKNEPAVIKGSWEVGQGTQYLIIDGLKWDWSGTEFGGGLYVAAGPTRGISYVCFRNGSTLGRGTETGTSTAGPDNQTSFGINNYGPDWSTAAEHIVLYNMKFSKGGMWMYEDGDPDGSGVIVGLRTRDVWVMDCEASYFSGGAYGFGVGNDSTPDDQATLRAYFGRCLAHHTAQFGFWSKRSKDCIMSQNVVHTIRRDTPSAPDAGGYGGQYGPINFWMIYNTTYNCQNGITIHGGASDGPGVTNGDVYIIGNKFYDIHDKVGTVGPWRGAFDQGAGTCILLRGGLGVHMVNNTMYDFDAGINSASSTQNRFVEGNILAGRNTAVSGLDAQFNSDPSRLNVFRKNIVQENSGNIYVRIGDSVHTSLSALNAGGALKSGNKTDITANIFTNAGAADFTLKADGLAIDAFQAEPEVYGLFETRYARSIRRDIRGELRPQGAAWDMGAFEHAAGTITRPHLRPPRSPR